MWDLAPGNKFLFSGVTGEETSKLGGASASSSVTRLRDFCQV